jgi:ubiquitin-protein ligase E3 C
MPAQVDLAPNGHEVAVTSDNRLAYIHRVADYRLNRQIREPAAAFLRGLHELIQPEWVRMFNEEELQVSRGTSSRACLVFVWCCYMQREGEMLQRSLL